MLQAFGLSLCLDPRASHLFDDLSLALAPGEKVALVGKNGVGKTKLLQILAGILPPDAGRVVQGGGRRVGYLPQDFDVRLQGTLREALGNAEEAPEGLPRLKRAMARLELPESYLEREGATLSLGERMRAALAALLAEEPDVLLLDEPTNHLDIAARQWLENFLLRCPQTVLMVCHDRAMVNAVATRVLELEGGTLREYAGGYDDMVRAKAMQSARQHEAWERQRAEERRLKTAAEEAAQRAAAITRRPTGRTYDPKAKAFYTGVEARMDKRAKAIRTRAAHVRERAVEKPFEADALALEFPARPLRSETALTVRGLRHAFGARSLFSGLSLTLARGQRLAVVGPNGCGKTTLFRILLGELIPDAGQIEWASGAAPAYLSQARSRLDPEKTALEALDPANASAEVFARILLGRLRIRRDAVHKPIHVLSVGERTKVELVQILLSPANVLLLDEPTNHLDIDSLEALEEALASFPGSVLFTSHDRAFVERVAHDVVELSED